MTALLDLPISQRLLPGPLPVEKTHRDGTHRTIDPATTANRVWARRRALGITRVADVTGLDRIGVPVIMVTRPNARSLAVNQGKGLTLDAARASGLMEAAETFHAEHPRLPLRLSTWRHLREELSTVDCDRLPRHPYGTFDQDRMTLWSPGVDLQTGTTTHLPYELVHTHYTTVPLPGGGSFLASSNGLASGNHPLEAVLHGLYEVVERDATVLWELAGPNAQDATAVDLDTVTDPGCCEVLERFAAARLQVTCWEQTSDIGIAVFAVEIIDGSDGLDGLPAAAGMGAHHDATVALARALTEAAQSRLTSIAGSRDDQPPSAYAVAADPDTLDAHRHELRRVAAQATRAFADAPHTLHDTLDEDVTHVLGALADQGLTQAVAVDLTRPDIGLDVVRVVVPGLEHLAFDHDEFVPGARALAVLENTDADAGGVA